MSDFTEEIDRYLSNNMEHWERKAFEERLSEDAELAASLNWQKSIYRALRDSEAIAFHRKLQIIRQNRATRQNTNKPKIPWPLIALTLGLIVALFFFVWWMSRPVASAPDMKNDINQQELPANTSSEPIADQESTKLLKSNSSPLKEGQRPKINRPDPQLLAQVEQQYKEQLYPSVDLNLQRSGSSTPMDSIADAFIKREYDLVLHLARKYSEEDPKYNMVAWTAANAAFLIDDCTMAITYGRRISELQESETKAQDAEFLLLLTYLKCGLTNDPNYLSLRKKIEKDAFHPAHEFVNTLNNR